MVILSACIRLFIIDTHHQLPSLLLHQYHGRHPINNFYRLYKTGVQQSLQLCFYQQLQLWVHPSLFLSNRSSTKNKRNAVIESPRVQGRGEKLKIYCKNM